MPDASGFFLQLFLNLAEVNSTGTTARSTARTTETVDNQIAEVADGGEEKNRYEQVLDHQKCLSSLLELQFNAKDSMSGSERFYSI